MQRTILVFFLTCAFFFLIIEKTSKGRRFKEKVSQRLSGVVGRTNEKKVPLLPEKPADKVVGA